MNIHNQTEILVRSRLLRSQIEVQEFEDAIASILSMNEVDHIKSLCLGFDDATEQDEIMFGLIHAIESYDKTFGPEEPLRKMAESIPTMLPHAKEWLKILHKRILNHERSRTVYAKVLLDIRQRSSNSSVGHNILNYIVSLVNDIKDKNPKRFEAAALDFLSNFKH